MWVVVPSAEERGSDIMATAIEFKEALLALTRGALAMSVAEEPVGSHRGPKVDVYLAGCVRGGKLLGLRGVPWCAGFASWCVWEAWAAVNLQGVGSFAGPLRPYGLDSLRWPYTDTGVLIPPIGYRAAVSELVADAKRSGAWHDEPGYVPAPGDLCVMGRAGQSPVVGGDGHVAVVDAMADPPAVTGYAFWAVGGNEDHTVCRTLRCVCHEPGVGPVEPVLGFIDTGAGLS